MALKASGSCRSSTRYPPQVLSPYRPACPPISLADYFEEIDMEHSQGAPYQPMAQTKIERCHRTVKIMVRLNNNYSLVEI